MNNVEFQKLLEQYIDAVFLSNLQGIDQIYKKYYTKVWNIFDHGIAKMYANPKNDKHKIIDVLLYERYISKLKK